MGGQGVRRKLAAILSADMVGYARHMRADEEGTLARLKSVRSDLIEPAIAAHHGRVVKFMGDGLIAEFASIVDAVHCAVALQRGFSERNKGLPDEEAIAFRVGINLGDVIAEDGDLYGDGVNLAERVQAFAEAGGICLSSDAYRQVRDKVDLHFVDLGEHAVKNIDEPVHIYKILQDSGGFDAAPAHKTEELLTRPAIAVLPFENMSGDPHDEYFSDGLTDDIITALTAWRSFPVIARNSCFFYKKRAVNVKQVARELGARYVLEGGVRKSGLRLRITAQLVDATSGHHIWAERFDRRLEDVFALQDEISQRIAAIIEPALERAELQRSANKRTTNLDAWDYYLRGVSCIHRFTREETARAREMFQAAVALDPTYSRAYAGLAWSYSRDLLLGHCENREETVAKLFEAAERAVVLDDLSSLAHHLLSTAYIWQDAHELAIAEGRRAVELNPCDADAIHALGNKLDLAGDPEGITRMEQAQQLNPQDPQRHMHLAFLARAYVNAGAYEKAVACAQRAIQRRTDYPHAYYILAIALGHLERTDEARAALDQCNRLHPGFVKNRSDWQPYTDPQRNEHLRRGLEKAGLGCA
jgi:adenylate cyclase